MAVASRKTVFQSKNPRSTHFHDSLRVSIPIFERPICWISDFGFFPIIQNMGFESVLTYGSFCGGRETNWSSVHHEDNSSLSLVYSDAVGLVDKHFVVQLIKYDFSSSCWAPWMAYMQVERVV